MYDAVIIGAGPAGLTAAIYMARAKYRCLVLEKNYYGGRIAITERVVNYPGIKEISGQKLTENMRIQAEKFGAEFEIGEAVEIKLENDYKTIVTKHKIIETLSVIIATGSGPAMAGFKGEEEFVGRGVSYCGTCDGRFFQDREVFVVGAGYSACQESMALSKYMKKVRMIVRKSDFSISSKIIDEINNNDRIEVLFNSEILEVSGKKEINIVRILDKCKDKIVEYKSADNEYFGVFVFVGYKPQTKFVSNMIYMDKGDYIVTDDCKNTNIEAIYAAGDVCVKELRQVVTATADGAIAAATAEKYLNKKEY